MHTPQLPSVHHNLSCDRVCTWCCTEKWCEKRVWSTKQKRKDWANLDLLTRKRKKCKPHEMMKKIH